MPALRGFVEQAVTLSSAFEGPIQWREDDHFLLMSLTFLSKQADHAKSILQLAPKKDVLLIARSMLDGLYQVLWVYRDQKRAFQWRAFAWIHDWRLLKAQEKSGQAIDATRMREINEALAKHGSLFIDPRKTGKQDPFHFNWRAGKTLRSIAMEIDGADLYDSVYSPMSEWEHWGTAGIGESLTRFKKGHLGFQSTCFDSSAQALALAFQCLTQTLAVVDAHLGMGKAEAIRSLQDEFLKTLDS